MTDCTLIVKNNTKHRINLVREILGHNLPTDSVDWLKRVSQFIEPGGTDSASARGYDLSLPNIFLTYSIEISGNTYSANFFVTAGSITGYGDEPRCEAGVSDGAEKVIYCTDDFRNWTGTCTINESIEP